MARITKRMSQFEAPDSNWTGSESTRRRGLLRDYGVAAAVVAGAVLAVFVLTAGPRDEPDRSPSAAAAQGAAPAEQADATTRTAPHCSWSVAPDAVVHARNPGAAPSAGSTLVAERCGGGWTGRVAWSTPEGCGPDGGAAGSANLSAEAERSERRAKLDGLARTHGR
jgi:hypothetical protein